MTSFLVDLFNLTKLPSLLQLKRQFTQKDAESVFQENMTGLEKPQKIVNKLLGKLEDEMKRKELERQRLRTTS